MKKFFSLLFILLIVIEIDMHPMEEARAERVLPRSLEIQMKKERLVEGLYWQQEEYRRVQALIQQEQAKKREEKK